LHLRADVAGDTIVDTTGGVKPQKLAIPG